MKTDIVLVIKCRNVEQRRRVIIGLENLGVLAYAVHFKEQIVKGTILCNYMFLHVWRNKSRQEVWWSISDEYDGGQLDIEELS